jgi:hypothetical protein
VIVPARIMVDDVNNDNTGWARFDSERKNRYRLARTLGGISYEEASKIDGIESLRHALSRRVVFVMLNPSTADAFKLDSTVVRCVSFAASWGAQALEVVNLFALRSTDPAALYSWTKSMSPSEWALENSPNLTAIMSACRGAERVIAAWGKHGALLAQGSYVRTILKSDGIKLYHLGLNKDGSPKHPLYLKGSTEPKEWTV